MPAVTSELYVKSSSLVDEKICIGLFAMEGDNVFFDYSKNKLKIAHKLDPSLDKNVCLHWLKNLKERITRDHRDDKMGFYRSDFNSATLKYLNTYSKGVFEFSKPKSLAAEVNDDLFHRLFEKIVGSELISGEKNKSTSTPSFITQFHSIIKRETFKKIDVGYKVKPKILPGIYTPHNVEFIGKNGGLIAGDTIDFNVKPESIEKSLFEFDRISLGLNTLSKKNKLTKKGNYYAYFSVPEEKEGKKILDLALKDDTKNFELKELDHLEKLSDRIERDEYGKFSEWVDSLSGL